MLKAFFYINQFSKNRARALVDSIFSMAINSYICKGCGYQYTYRSVDWGLNSTPISCHEEVVVIFVTLGVPTMTTNGSRQGCLKSQQWPINISYFCACPWQVAFTMIGTCVLFLWTDKWSVALGCIIFNPISAHQEMRSHILQNNSSEIMKLVEKYRNGYCNSEVQFGRSFQPFKFLFYTISRYL